MILMVPLNAMASTIALTQPPIQPSHVLDFSDIGDLFSATLSPDGERLYVLVHGTFVDLGAAVAQYWPHWGAVATGLFALPLLFILIRRLRREQRDGEPYCRRCNYNLSAQPNNEGRCPECGIDLASRPPIRGRRAWKRAAPWAAMLLIVLAAYGGLWAFRVPRGAPWLNPGWVSSEALKLIDRKGFEWLKPYRRQGDVVLEVDASTGQRLRTVCGRASSTYFHLVMTPDGSGFYLLRTDANGLDLVSTKTGRVRATFSPDSASGRTLVSPQAPTGTAYSAEFCYEVGGASIIGHTEDGSAILSYWSDPGTTAYASLWNSTTGAVSRIASTPAYIDKRSGRNFCQGRQFVRVGRLEPVQVISVPLFMEAFPTSSYVVRWFDRAGTQTRTLDLKTAVSSNGLPAVMPDGQLAVFADKYGRSLMGLDLSTGEKAGAVDLGDSESIESPVLAPDGLRLLVGGNETIKVRDTRRMEWTVALSEPAGFYAPRAITSPTMNRAAAVFQGAQLGPTNWTFCVAIWDIPPRNSEDKP